ncbi:hypothetical protein BaRGS_00008042 [Batillaria attramentaria]|uniref:Uncharacterized protein n=1 Tax=Batillaria attramentaria TaxID=370345 RepID=A0ABD0LMW4_9CAEN
MTACDVESTTMMWQKPGKRVSLPPKQVIVYNVVEKSHLLIVSKSDGRIVSSSSCKKLPGDSVNNCENKDVDEDFGERPPGVAVILF